MEWLWTYSFLFMIGAVITSFCIVCGIRIPLGWSLSERQSRCDSCFISLRWYELIPVLSYMVQLGKCRTCHRRIPFMYMLFEMCGGFYIMYLYTAISSFNLFILYMILFYLLVTVTVSDLLYGLIPNEILLMTLLLFLLYTFLTAPEEWIVIVTRCILLFVLFYVVWYFSQHALGGGDVKLFVVIGTIVGITTLMKMLMIASLLALFVFVYVGIKKQNWHVAVPFAPFLFMSWFIYLFWQ